MKSGWFYIPIKKKEIRHTMCAYVCVCVYFEIINAFVKLSKIK